MRNLADYVHTLGFKNEQQLALFVLKCSCIFLGKNSRTSNYRKGFYKPRHSVSVKNFTNMSITVLDDSSVSSYHYFFSSDGGSGNPERPQKTQISSMC